MKRLVLLLVALACLSMPCSYADTITGSERVIIDANFFSAVVTLGRGTTVTPLLACSMGVFADDGCGGAPAPLTASFAKSNLLTPGGFANTKAGTLANYMATDCGASGTAPCRPPWNVAGNADDGYHIGHYTPCDTLSVACGSRTNVTCAKTIATFDGSCLLDPAIAGALPTGCTYTPTPTAGVGPVVVCGSGFLGTLQHINFGPVNGHTCTAFQLFGSGGASLPLLFDDFSFFNDSGQCSTINIWFTFESGQNWSSPLISNGEVDGNSSTFGDTLGAAACVPLSGNAGKCNPINAFAVNSGNLVTLKYVAVHDMSYQTVGAGDLLLEFSWVQEWCARGPTCHGEWYLGSNVGNSPNELFDHNVILGDTHQSQGSPSPLFALSAWGPTIGNFQFTNNVVINQYSGGMIATAGSVAGCIGMPPSGGVATNPTCTPGTPTTANIFYETANTNGFGQGIGFSVAPNECNLTSGGIHNAAPAQTYTLIPGPYAVTSPPIIAEFNVDGFTGLGAGGAVSYAFGTLAGGGGLLLSPSASCPIGQLLTTTFTPISATNGTYTGVSLTDVSSGGVGGTANITVSGGIVSGVAVSAIGSGYLVGDTLAASITGGTVPIAVASVSGNKTSAATGTIGVFSASPAPVTNVTVQNNYIDASSNSNNEFYQFAVAQNTGALFVSISGGTALISTDVTVTNGEFLFSPSIAGCATSLFSCPQITSASNTYPITGGAGAIVSGSAINVSNTAIQGYVNETPSGFTGTITGLNTLTTTTSQTLTAGDFVYDPTGGTCTGVAPSTCPKIATTATGTTFSITGAAANVSGIAMNTVRLHINDTGTINNANPSALGVGNVFLQQANVSTPFGPFIQISSCSLATTSSLLSTCPRITGGTTQNTLFAVSPGATVGGANSFVGPISVIQPSWCVNPAVFGGNVDMTANLSDAFMNAWSNPPQAFQVGC